MADISTVGGRIRAARESAQLTQASLAGAAHVRGPAIWRYEQGGGPPRGEILVRIAAACGVSLEWLATGTGQRGAVA